MGFGSYDESEQQAQDVDTDESEIEGISAHENDHDGELTFESESSTNELLDQLETIKDDGDDDE